MGLFDRFFAPRQATPAATQPEPESENSEASPTTRAPTPAGSVKPLLAEARDHLDAQNTEAALAIYQKLLGEDSGAGGVTARADVLVTISGDLGSTGHLREITELIGPCYDAQKHGPATGLNLLQAYIALRNVDAAQHILDLLFGLERPELEERLHGFSNAIAELIAQGQFAPTAPVSPSVGPSDHPADDGAAQAVPPPIALVTISKPIWSYGLEDALGELFPTRDSKKNVRRIAFAQLALPGLNTPENLATQPEDELGRLSRAIPIWLAETFSYSPLYAPLTAVGVRHSPGNPGHYALFPSEWTTDNLRQLVESSGGEAGGALDYIFTGALQEKNGDTMLTLRVWEVRKFRERKKIVLRWTPATADAELTKLHQYLRQFMEWRECGAGEPGVATLRYAPPAQPLRWLHTLGTSLTLFLTGKDVLAREQLPPVEPLLRGALNAAQEEHKNETSTLAALTLLARARDLGALDEHTLTEATTTLFQLEASPPDSTALITKARTALEL